MTSIGLLEAKNEEKVLKKLVIQYPLTKSNTNLPPRHFFLSDRLIDRKHRKERQTDRPKSRKRCVILNKLFYKKTSHAAVTVVSVISIFME